MTAHTWSCDAGTWRLQDSTGAVLATMTYDRGRAMYVDNSGAKLGGRWEDARARAEAGAMSKAGKR
jgi:hypothetical protein